MFIFRNYFKGWSLGRGLAPPQIIVMKLHIKKMNFQMSNDFNGAP